MSWLNEHKRAWRVVMLGLLFVALVGPWAFDLVNVPAEYACSAPYIRLKGDYCGEPVSGMGILPALVGELINMVMGLVTGAPAITDLGWGFLVILSALLLFLPVLTTLLLILPRNRPGRQGIQWVVWGLAAVSSLVWLSFSPAEWLPGPLWGRWLYIGLASSMLIVEGVLAVRRGPSRAG